ncbi:MAG TPA: hypothetical protein PK566_05695 [Pseudobacteroides sp.]|nr:hypothetical protein [Pseudobacteroides sp.]
MLIVIWLMILLIPGLIGVFAYEFVSRNQIRVGYRFISLALIFDLFALIFNLLWLRFIKLVYDFDALLVYLNCLSFTPKYAILNIILCIIYGVILGLICRCFIGRNHRYIEKGN